MTSALFTRRNVAITAFLLVALQVLVLYLFGQPPMCTCGTIKVWEGVVLSAGNSQHLSDWYSFSHIIHGAIFYGLLAWLMPRVPVRIRLLIAFGVEIGWEILENTPAVIQHYREQALAQGYTGDSIINSVSDTAMMAFGFILTYKLPWWVIVLLALVFEGFSLYMIRDNLTLNIVNLIHAFPSIAAWQAGGGIH
jgi:hypothetical protein